MSAVQRVQENQSEVIHYHTPPQYVKCQNEREKSDEPNLVGFVLALKELIASWKYARSFDDRLDRASDEIEKLLIDFKL